MSLKTLEAEHRTKTGKQASKSFRREGNIPAVIYGNKTEPIPVLINRLSLEAIFRKDPKKKNALIELSINQDGKVQKETVISYRQDVHPISDQLTHVDFLKIDYKRPIGIEVDVKISGTAKGQKFGGIVIQNRKQVKIACLPNDIPEFINFDITPLNIGDVIHLSDVALPEGASFITEPHLTLLHVEAPRVEKAGAGSAESENSADVQEDAEGGKT